MPRQAAFAETGKKMLKGALHCHTTRSDGRGSPEAVIALHAQNGYDFMALTDHRYYNFQNFAPDVKMTIVPGMELDYILPPGRGVHCFHTVAIGPVEGNGFAQDQRFESGKVENQAEFQPVLDMLHAAGNMTIYCHPEWSATPACEFDQMQGNFAMEIWNSGCAMENELDTNAAGWDDLLFKGVKIWGVATDDGHAMDQHCNGWVRVNADNDVPSILQALKDGAFYSSCGPEIYDFTVEDGVAKVKCSPCAKIGFRYALLPTNFVCGEGITEAEFKIPEYFDIQYLRAVVKDAKGRRAWTNPIFL